MNTMVQVYVAKTKKRAQKLNDDICEAFAGSGHFIDNHLVVTPVEPIYDTDDLDGDPKAYGFLVYFDTVEFGDDVQADILIDRHNIVRDLHSLKRNYAENETSSKFFRDDPIPKYVCESPNGEFFTEQDVKKHLTEMGFEVF